MGCRLNVAYWRNYGFTDGHQIPGVDLGIRGGGGGGVPSGSPNPDPISDQNMPFSIPVFRPDL